MTGGTTRVYTCAVCGKVTPDPEFILKNHGAFVPGTNVQLPDFRPLYYALEGKISFCSAACSTEWYNKNGYNRRVQA